MAKLGLFQVVYPPVAYRYSGSLNCFQNVNDYNILNVCTYFVFVIYHNKTYPLIRT